MRCIWSKSNRLVLFAVGLLFISDLSQANTMLGSKHDLTSLDQRAGTGVMVGVAYDNYQNACVYCHTPHRPAGEVSTSDGAPLWNRELPITEYKLYQSPTLDGTISQPTGMSLACLSCHDGTLAVDRVLKRPAINTDGPVPAGHMRITSGSGDSSCGQCHRTGASNISGIHDLGIAAFGNNLGDDHPVSITYPSPRQDKQFVPQPGDGIFGNGVKLFDGKVECASCHDVHNAQTVPFLRAGLQRSSLCMTCHIK